MVEFIMRVSCDNVKCSTSTEEYGFDDNLINGAAYANEQLKKYGWIKDGSKVYCCEKCKNGSQPPL